MTEEKKVVLKMLEEGKISAEEAERLLETFKTEASQRAEKSGMIYHQDLQR